MKEFMALLTALALAVVAWAMPEPPADDPPEFAGPEAPGVGASPIGSVWHCPWIESGDFGDGAFLMASLPPTDVRLSLPSPIPNEEPLEEEISVAGPGSRVQYVSDLVRFGATPGSVEFDDGPAGVAAFVESPLSLSGDRCARAIPKVSYFPGGTTRDGRGLVVRLFNPFPDLAKVNVRGISEFGAEPLPELGSSIDVPGRYWVDVDLGEIAPLLDDFLVVVESVEGLVVPAIALDSEGQGDDATWPGTGLASAWDFPLVATEDLVPELVVANPSAAPVTIDVEGYGVLGPEPAIAFEEVPPESQLRIPLPDIGGAYGIRVAASDAIAAVVVAETPVDLLGEDSALPGAEPEDAGVPFRSAATVGSAAPARRWLLPGAGAVQDAVQTVWLMNTGEQPATVALKPLGVQEIASDKVIVQPGTIVRFRVPDDNAVASYFVEATVPISAAWSASNDYGVAFVAGISIDE